MFKLCGTFLLGAMSCLGLQRVGAATTNTVPVPPVQDIPVEIQRFEHAEKVVWMQINDHAYSEVTLNRAAIKLLEKSTKQQRHE